MPLKFSNKTKSPFELLRSGVGPRLIIYDVLGHFPEPRDHLSSELRRQFNLRSRNGFLFSTQDDLVLTSCLLDPEHQRWLKLSGLAQGEAYLVPGPGPDSQVSFFESFLQEQSQIEVFSRKLTKKGLELLFSWMNSPNEARLADILDLTMAWRTPRKLLHDHFNKVCFKEILKALALPLVKGFVVSQGEFEGSFQQKCESLDTEQRWIARPSEAAAGSGIFTFTKEQIPEAMKRITAARPTDWLIEEFFENCRSINLQVFVKAADQLVYLGISEQRLNQFMYSGNHAVMVGPGDTALKECLRQAEKIAWDLAKIEYTGLIGLDFVITAGGQVYCIENNIRINGSTFSLALIAQLEAALGLQLNWSFEKMSVARPISFSEVLSLLQGELLTLSQPRASGVFVQEYTMGPESTQFGLTFVSAEANGLAGLRQQVNKKLNASVNS